MAYTTIPSSQIQVGEPVRKELWQTTKDDLDDLDSRTAALEAAGATESIMDEYIVNLGQYSQGGSTGVIASIRIKQDFNLTEARIHVIRNGTSGTIEMDVKKGNDLASLSSMMSTKPSVGFGAGDNADSTNQIFSTNLIQEGQFLAVEFTQLQAGIGPIHIQILGEPA